MSGISSTREIYEFLPELLTLVEQTWGITLSDIMMLPQFFAVLTFALLAAVSLSKIQITGKAAGALKTGLVFGAMLSALGSLLLLSKSFGVMGTLPVVLAGGVTLVIGLVMVGSALTVFVHSVYDRAC